jgi:hypothetical protein
MSIYPSVTSSLIKHKEKGGGGEWYQLVFSASDIGDVHVVSGGTEIFVFPLSEDLNKFVNLMELNGEDRYINSNQMDFGVTMFSGFRGTHIDNLFPATLAHTDSHANHEVCPRTLQGRLLIRTYPFLRSAEHCIGKLSPCQYYSTKKDENREISRGDVPIG